MIVKNESGQLLTSVTLIMQQQHEWRAFVDRVGTIAHVYNSEKRMKTYILKSIYSNGTGGCRTWNLLLWNNLLMSYYLGH